MPALRSRWPICITTVSPQRDEVLAHVWAAMAAAQEHPEAETLLARIERGLSGQELQQARRLYARWQIEPMPTVSP